MFRTWKCLEPSGHNVGESVSLHFFWLTACWFLNSIMQRFRLRVDIYYIFILKCPILNVNIYITRNEATAAATPSLNILAIIHTTWTYFCLLLNWYEVWDSSCSSIWNVAKSSFCFCSIVLSTRCRMENNLKINCCSCSPVDGEPVRSFVRHTLCKKSNSSRVTWLVTCQRSEWGHRGVGGQLPSNPRWPPAPTENQNTETEHSITHSSSGRGPGEVKPLVMKASVTFTGRFVLIWH